MRIAICCKQTLLAESLTCLLTQRGGFTVVGGASDVRSCIALAKEAAADVLLLLADSIERTELGFLLGARTYGNFKTVLVFHELRPRALSHFEFDAEFTLASESEALFETLREYREQSRVKRIAVAEPRQPYHSHDLTKRERDVAMLVAQGLSNRSIAESAQLQEQSVKNLVSVIMRKLSCDNRVQVALKLSNGERSNGSGHKD